MAYLMIWKERNKFTVAGNHECDETDSVVSEVSSFVDNPEVLDQETKSFTKRL